VVSGGTDHDAVRLELDRVLPGVVQRVVGHVPGRADQRGWADGQPVLALLGLVLGLARGAAVVELGLGLHLAVLLAGLLPPPAGAAEFSTRLGRAHRTVDGRADGTQGLQLLHEAAEHDFERSSLRGAAKIRPSDTAWPRDTNYSRTNTGARINLVYYIYFSLFGTSLCMFPLLQTRHTMYTGEKGAPTLMHRALCILSRLVGH